MDTISLIFLLLALGCAGNYFAKFRFRSIRPNDRSLSASLINTGWFAAIISGLFFLTSYGWYIEGFALLLIVPLDLIALCFIGAFIFIAIRKRLLLTRLLWLLPMVWWLSWNYLARPGGLWVRFHSAQAFASFVLPPDATEITHHEPGPGGYAQFETTFLSTMSLEELTSFYSRELTQRGFTIQSITDDPMHCTGSYYPYRMSRFRTIPANSVKLGCSTTLHVKRQGVIGQ